MSAEKAVVLDLGSSSVKAGFSRDDIPTAVFSNLIGKPAGNNGLIGFAAREYYIGDEAQELRGILNLSYPIRHGVVTDWEALQSVLTHVFYKELSINPSEHPVIVTDSIFNSSYQRVKYFETAFETFDLPAFYMVNQATAALYSTGSTTGLVVNCGDGVTQVVPVYEGQVILEAFQRQDGYSGRELTEFLLEILMRKLPKVFKAKDANSNYEIAKDMKEKHCHVPLGSYENAGTVDYEMPDGFVVELGSERFLVGDAVFKPSLMGYHESTPSLQELVLNAISSCRVDIRQALFRSIYLCGGNSVLRGFEKRLEDELRAKTSSSVNPRVNAPPERKYSTWIGSSILTSLSSFEKKWITKEDFAEMGPQRLLKLLPA